MYQSYLSDELLLQMMEKVDLDLSQKCKVKPCERCQSKLHCDNYPRKLRGGPEHWDRRYSFTCAAHRHRTTPPSVRFLGRKVYLGVVVVLISALRHGLKPDRVKCLKHHLNIDRRTLEHWLEWWLERFVRCPFWRDARARFMPILCEHSLPLALCEAFKVERRDRLLDLLKFLTPITTGAGLFARNVMVVGHPAEDAH